MIGKTVSHYKIISKLGEGGMGAVYLADDARLDRKVALKFLPPHLTNDAAALTRFEREAKSAAALQHPNIVTVYEIGEYEGGLFIAMAYIGGDRLSDLIEHKDMSMDRALDIATQVCDGLDEAHRAGIVHRDIKPDNILFDTSGRAMLADFGLATGVGMTKLTQEGSTVGTLHYMSPEQTSGETIDARSDIFSVGAILYEMITGQHAFAGDHVAAIVYSITNEDPQPLSRYNNDATPELERIVFKALSKDPQTRYQSTADLIADLRALRSVGSSAATGTTASLPPSTPGAQHVPTPSSTSQRDARPRWFVRGLVGAAALIVVAAGLGWWVFRDANETAPAEAINSIAVLPFAVPSGDSSVDFLGDGIAENVINSLATLPGLRVIPRSVAFRQRGRDDELEAVAKELDVRVIVTGRVSRRGDQLIVAVELTDVSELSQLWGNRFDTSIDEILTVESAIASRITDALRIELSGEEADRIVKRYTEVPAAHLAYMEARHAWGTRSAAGFQTALGLYDTAIAADPRFALAHAGKAETYVLMMLYIGTPAKYASLLRQEVDAAVRLDPELAQAYPVQGFVFAIEQRWSEADAAFRRAIELDPNYATAHHWSGVLSLAIGDLEGYLAQLEEARRLDPGSAIIATDVGTSLAFMGRVAEAEVVYNEVLEAYPTFWRAREGLGNVHWLAGRYEDAARTYERTRELCGDIAWMDGTLAMAYGKAGDLDRARHELQRMEERATGGTYVSPLGFARAYMGLGDMERCFQWLERAATERDPMFMIGVFRFYTEITADRRWPALEERMNYPE